MTFAQAAHSLRGRQDIDPRRIFVAGHSLGDLLLPRIAAKRSQTWLVSSAWRGAPSPLRFHHQQLDYIASLEPAMSADEKQSLDKLKKQAIEVKSMDLAHAKPSRIVMGAHGSYWSDLRAYSPTKAARHMKRPMLILQGERDDQVTMRDCAKWRTALAGRKNATFKTYPALITCSFPGTANRGRRNTSNPDMCPPRSLTISPARGAKSQACLTGPKGRDHDDLSDRPVPWLAVVRRDPKGHCGSGLGNCATNGRRALLSRESR